MAQYNSLNVKLSNSQLNKLKSAIKNETEVVLRLSSNMIGDNESNFPPKSFLPDLNSFHELMSILEALCFITDPYSL